MFAKLLTLFSYDNTLKLKLNYILNKHMFNKGFLPKLNFNFLFNKSKNYFKVEDQSFSIVKDFRTNTLFLTGEKTKTNSFTNYINWVNFRVYNWKFKV